MMDPHGLREALFYCAPGASAEYTARFQANQLGHLHSCPSSYSTKPESFPPSSTLCCAGGQANSKPRRPNLLLASERFARNMVEKSHRARGDAREAEPAHVYLVHEVGDAHNLLQISPRHDAQGLSAGVWACVGGKVSAGRLCGEGDARRSPRQGKAAKKLFLEQNISSSRRKNTHPFILDTKESLRRTTYSPMAFVCRSRHRYLVTQPRRLKHPEVLVGQA